MRAVLALLVFLAAVAPAHAAQPGFAYSHGGQLVTAAADGTGRVTLVGDLQISDPVWSPDGSMLAHVTYPEIISRFAYASVFLRRLGDARRTALPGGGDYTAWPAWTPDGAELVLSVVDVDPDTTGTSLVAIDLRSGARRTLTSTGHSDSDLDVSPDGRWVAFARDNAAVWIVPLTGGEAVRVTDGTDPTWSPDGRRLAIVRHRDIAIHDLASGATERIRSPGSDVEPAWSPDGRRILFSSNRDFRAAHSFEIHSMDPDGGCVTQLTWSAVPAGDPDARPGVPAHRGRCGGRTVRYRGPKVSGRWLYAGRRFGDLLLSTYGRDVAYRDCARPGRCRAPLELSHRSACAASAELRDLGGWRRFGAARYARGPHGRWILHTGRRVVEIRGAGRDPLPVLRRLGRLARGSTRGC